MPNNFDWYTDSAGNNYVYKYGTWWRQNPDGTEKNMKAAWTPTPVETEKKTQPNAWDILVGNDNPNNEGLLGGYDQLINKLPGDIGSIYENQGGKVGSDFTIGNGNTGIPGTDLNIPISITPGTPDPLIGDPDKKNVGLPKGFYGDPNIPVPTFYGGRDTLDLGDLTTDLARFDIAEQNILAENKFATNPNVQTVEEISKNQLQQNLQTFDKVNRSGSFEVQSVSDRPFGGAALKEAFVETPNTAFEDLGGSKKGNSIFRWA